MPFVDVMDSMQDNARVVEQKGPDPRSDMRELLDLAALGFMFPVAIGAGFLIGRWLDATFGTWPWLTGLFSVLGMAAAFSNLFRSGTRGSGHGR